MRGVAVVWVAAGLLGTFGDARAAALRAVPPSAHPAEFLGQVGSGVSAGWYSPERPQDVPATLARRSPRSPNGAARVSAPSVPMIGTTFGRYRVVEACGAGGMGVVYRAEDLDLRRPVALKFLPTDVAPDDELRARLLREARTAAALNHPNICTVYEVGETADGKADAPGGIVPAGTPFIAMEFIAGETLAERIARDGPLPIDDTLNVAIQVAEGLAEAHARQIVHRDLKPGNVMIMPQGRVKILDFGLAKPLNVFGGVPAKITTSQAISVELGHLNVVGTCGYMSPEQALGKPAAPWSDVFSFGIIVHEMVTGVRPFHADTAAAVLAKIIEGDPPPLASGAAHVPATLAAIVARCLRKPPEARYRDAAPVVVDLIALRRQLSQDGARTPTEVARPLGKEGAAIRAGTAARRWRPAVALTLLLLAAPLAYSLILRTKGPVGEPARGAIQHADQPPVPPHVQAPSPPSGLTPNAAATASVHVERPRPTAASPTHERLPRETALTAVTARLEITSSPAAAVSLDGQLVGVTPLSLAAPPGVRELTLTSPDGPRWRGRIELTAGQTSTVHRELAATGSLAVVSSDVWAEVSLDDGPLEQTPVHFGRVGAGLHDVRAFRDGYVPSRLEVLVEADSTTHVRLRMEKKP